MAVMQGICSFIFPLPVLSLFDKLDMFYSTCNVCLTIPLLGGVSIEEEFFPTPLLNYISSLPLVYPAP